MDVSVVRRSARALLIDENGNLVLMRRKRPGQAPYLVAVGGGVEDQDRDAAAALRREVAEELGGTVGEAARVLVVTDEVEGGCGVQHVFVARLLSMNTAARTGSEFTKPERGSYDVVRIPFTADAIRALEVPLMPPALGAFVRDNVPGIRDALDDARVGVETG